jgi:hypothetical protein
MIDTLRQLRDHARAHFGSVSCADPETSSSTCIDEDALTPSTDDSAMQTPPADQDIELMRYLLLSIVAAY